MTHAEKYSCASSLPAAAASAHGSAVAGGSYESPDSDLQQSGELMFDDDVVDVISETGCENVDKNTLQLTDYAKIKDFDVNVPNTEVQSAQRDVPNCTAMGMMGEDLGKTAKVKLSQGTDVAVENIWNVVPSPWPDVYSQQLQSNSTITAAPATKRDISKVQSSSMVKCLSATGDHTVDNRARPTRSPVAKEAANFQRDHQLPMEQSVAKAGDERFVSQFYNNSRLHHLSTWGSEFKAYVAKLQEQENPTFPGREKLHQNRASLMDDGQETHRTASAKFQKVVIHIDMDCFFVSVGLLSRPDLKGDLIYWCQIFCYISK